MAVAPERNLLSQLVTARQGSVCHLRLDVAVTASHESGRAPRTHFLKIQIRDENDHAPVFQAS
ncbi:unnamed protein product [Dibothriocephalus latus]|uniref:Cadherin domain-containing protein n=1 Tax=Dibothriocephalus latus TaxID=60516 RepID=A0A3P6PR86_DIBLA|nr:unnamed protein product [Dibothriocephalus latus]